MGFNVRAVELKKVAGVEKLTTMGFGAGAAGRPGSASAGVVVSQRPGPATTLARGATVTIGVSSKQAPSQTGEKSKP